MRRVKTWEINLEEIWTNHALCASRKIKTLDNGLGLEEMHQKMSEIEEIMREDGLKPYVFAWKIYFFGPDGKELVIRPNPTEYEEVTTQCLR